MTDGKVGEKQGGNSSGTTGIELVTTRDDDLTQHREERESRGEMSVTPATSAIAGTTTVPTQSSQQALPPQEQALPPPPPPPPPPLPPRATTAAPPAPAAAPPAIAAAPAVAPPAIAAAPAVAPPAIAAAPAVAPPAIAAAPAVAPPAIAAAPAAAPPPRLSPQQLELERLQQQRAVISNPKQVARPANAILIGAALVATVTYAGWLFLPFSDIRSGHYFATKVFWVFNSLAFFSAIVTVWLCVATVWPFKAQIPWPLESVEKRLKFALVFFAFSFASVVTAYSSGAYVVVTKDLDFIITDGPMLRTIIAGAVLCGLTILFSLVLVIIYS